MMSRLSSFLLILFLPACALAQQVDTNIHIYILMGQSNMAGRGKLTDYYKKQRHERVIMLTKDNQWKPAVHPLHFDKPKAAGVGPGLTFGIQMAEAYPAITVGLVPCAVGGTSIAKWVPGAVDSVTRTHPYDDALIRIKEAMKRGVIKGIIWHQGEGDSNVRSSAIYLDNLAALIGRIRKETGNPALPVVVGQLARYRERYHLINQQLTNLPGRVPNTAVVSSEGLWHKGDGTHFDSPSAAEFGRRFADGMLQLQQHGTTVTATMQSGKDGWEPLFNGADPNTRWRSLSGDRFPEQGWLVDGNELVLLPGREGKDVITREQFSDFELELEYKLTDSANTGIKYFVSELTDGKGKTTLNGPEFQLIDDYKHESVKNGKSPETSTGSLYLLYAPKGKSLNKPGEWNRVKIISRGKTVEHWLNGKMILRYERGSDDFRKHVANTKFNEYKEPYGEAEAGHILLQDHHDGARFKNIRIRRL